MRKALKAVKYAAAAIGLLFILDITYITYFGAYKADIKKSDAIIILGAAINTPALYNRSLEGLNLYKQGKADVIVLSGGRVSDTDVSEAGYMKKVISKNSSQPVPVILEEGSHTTFENIRNSRNLIPEAQSVIIVSDRFHLARAVLLAKRAGFKDVYWSAPGPYYYSTTELAFYYFREAVAMISYIPHFIAY